MHHLSDNRLRDALAVPRRGWLVITILHPYIAGVRMVYECHIPAIARHRSTLFDLSS